MVTPDGYLYDREVIVSYMLRQKRAIARQLAEYERLKERAREEESLGARVAEEMALKRFVDGTCFGALPTHPPSGSSGASGDTPVQRLLVRPRDSDVEQAKAPDLKAGFLAHDAGKTPRGTRSFWVPNATPRYDS